MNPVHEFRRGAGGQETKVRLSGRSRHLFVAVVAAALGAVFPTGVFADRDPGDRGSDRGGASEHFHEPRGGDIRDGGSGSGGGRGSGDLAGDHGGGGSGSSQTGSGDRSGSDGGSGGSGSGGGSGGSGSGDSSGGSGPDGGSGDSSGSGSGGSSDDSGKNGGAVQSAGIVSPNRAPIEIAYDRLGHAYRAGEIVVLGDASTAVRARGLGLRVIEERPLTSLGASLLLIATPGSGPSAMVIAKIQAAAPGTTAALNYIYRLSGTAGRDKALLPSGMRVAKPSKTGGRLGLVDTLVDRAYPGLGNAVLEERSFAKGAAAQSYHGTAIAYLAASRGAWLLAANVFAKDRSGAPAASADALARAVDWLISRGVPVVNFSLEGPANPVMAAVIRRAQGRGCIIVAAAGNSGPAAPPAYPAAYPSVIAVTALDSGEHVYPYANRGDYIGFSAMGVRVDAPLSSRAMGPLSGTSYASPIVAARIAGMLDRPNPGKANAVIRVLRSRAKDLGAPGKDPVYGYGAIS